VIGSAEFPKEDIPLDGLKSIDLLVEYGEELAERIDWEAILAGMDTTLEQYKQVVIPAKSTISRRQPEWQQAGVLHQRGSVYRYLINRRNDESPTYPGAL
jgi:hypothetical protein